MSVLKPHELATGRERIKAWPRDDRVALTKLPEPEAAAIVLATALLDLRPVPEDDDR